jgi:hypothetical protein
MVMCSGSAATPLAVGRHIAVVRRRRDDRLRLMLEVYDLTHSSEVDMQPVGCI